MTDKEQIIIDEMNVIVQECIFWQEGHCDCCQSQNKYPHCLDYPNCYFKQLSRKTQECEELKEKNALLESQMAFNLSEMEAKTLLKELKRLDKIKDEYREMLENLKAEEKFLKQCCQKAGEELAKHSFEYDGKEKNLVVQAMELNEKYEKFKKALEEIEEMAKTCLNQDVCILCPYSDKCENPYDVLVYEPSRGILEIINKTKDGE